jgi:ankyrin repeat protein
LSDERKSELLESLRFEQIDIRQMTIKTAHIKTCKWLLKNPDYLDWLDPTKFSQHHGFLWIKGKAGTGKSTMMKFALVTAYKIKKRHVVISFFFNARGEDLEKSTAGAYRSLLSRLLEQLPILLNVFDSNDIATIKTKHQWDTELLQSLLERAISRLGDSSVVCFIDALDECEDTQVRDMIQFFERVGEQAVSNGTRFLVCFSSRHYPHITIRRGNELVLDHHEGHTQDIANYIETELHIGKSSMAQHIRDELLEKASGIFMWVVLVVGILNKEHDRGQMHAMRKRLKEIPGDLYELFRDILTRDAENKSELMLCIQWVLFAKHPLTAEQLYHAILREIDPEALTELNFDEITKEDMQRYILNSSKGLAETTAAKDQKVQFIHETVKDFLLKENGLAKIWPDYENGFESQSHERLKQCCLNYIKADVIASLDISDDLPRDKRQDDDLRQSVIKKIPFLEYAVLGVLYHADLAARDGVSQTRFLNDFPLQEWIRLDNLLQKYKVRRHTKNVSCLYILAENNLTNLVESLSVVEPCTEIEGERYGCALFAAVATESANIIEIFLKRTGIRQDPATSPSSSEGSPDFSLSTRPNSRAFTYSKKKGILLSAAELRHEKAFAVAALSRYDTEADRGSGDSTLLLAIDQGFEVVASYLIGTDPSLMERPNKRRETPLQRASHLGNENLARILLTGGANINAPGGLYGTALVAASARGHETVALMLLDKGADINASGGPYGTALVAACARGHETVALTLLDKGADINASGGPYGTALVAACARGYETVSLTLLDKGADINASGGPYSSALAAACAGGHEAVAMMLLEKGADANAQSSQYGSALTAACHKGLEKMALMLLEKGADINTLGGPYSSALAAACAGGHEAVAMMLLEKGADANAQSSQYGSTLTAACHKGLVKVVIMLLEKGADVNAPASVYGSALYAASEENHTEVVRLLVETDAKAFKPKMSNGNHAIQEYQMQMMLLEQQNKKRLLMSRQDHGR